MCEQEYLHFIIIMEQKSCWSFVHIFSDGYVDTQVIFRKWCHYPHEYPYSNIVPDVGWIWEDTLKDDLVHIQCGMTALGWLTSVCQIWATSRP